MPRKNSVVEGDGKPGRMPPRMGAAQRAPGLKGYATMLRRRINELRGGFRRENQRTSKITSARDEPHLLGHDAVRGLAGRTSGPWGSNEPDSQTHGSTPGYAVYQRLYTGRGAHRVGQAGRVGNGNSETADPYARIRGITAFPRLTRSTWRARRRPASTFSRQMTTVCSGSPFRASTLSPGWM